LTTARSDALAALLALFDGADEPANETPDGVAHVATPEGADAAIARLPVALALSTALVLARSGDAGALRLAEAIYAQLRPLLGRELKVDDELAKIALALGRPGDAITILASRLEASASLAA
jgi:hypothetical protein